MRWVILTLTAICGLMLVNQASLSHRIHALETERDKLQTDLQSQNQRLDRTQSLLQDTHGWNEIDAIELVGRDGSRQWASSANASSTYAERAPVSVQSLLPSSQ